MAKLTGVMREAFNKPEDRSDGDWAKWTTFDARFRRLVKIPLLAVDEIDQGRVNNTPFAAELRGRLLEHRYRDGIADGDANATVFAGNDDPARWQGWIGDRVRDGRFRVFHHEGASARPQMEWFHES